MSELQTMSDSVLQQHHTALAQRYHICRSQKLQLNMSRGIPSTEQLDLSADLFNCLGKDDYTAADGTDCRNYGGIDGLPEAKALFAEILKTAVPQVLIGGNSSLTLMHDLLVRAMLHGFADSNIPWLQEPKIKFLCPSPGYDRHFLICEYLGIEMIPVAYRSDGPDLDHIEQLVADPSVKGIWCVPRHSNPTGVTYTDAVVKRLAAVPATAPDFRILWDNAYAVHHLVDQPAALLNILSECAAAGHPDRAFVFTSTSKISFAGGGLCAVAASENNINWLKKQVSVQSIGPDKLNQLRHVRFFKNKAGVQAHMKRHAAIIKPKFDLVLTVLETELGGRGLAAWSKPQGGYFISFDTLPGCAKKVVEKTAAAGVLLTPAGATFPYGRDPEDKNIRLAPTFPPLPELKQAIELMALCVQLVSAEQELAKRGLQPLA